MCLIVWCFVCIANGPRSLDVIRRAAVMTISARARQKAEERGLTDPNTEERFVCGEPQPSNSGLRSLITAGIDVVGGPQIRWCGARGSHDVHDVLPHPSAEPCASRQLQQETGSPPFLGRPRVPANEAGPKGNQGSQQECEANPYSHFHRTVCHPHGRAVPHSRPAHGHYLPHPKTMSDSCAAL